MSEPVENLYFNWLCAKVQRVEVPTPSLTYWNLLRDLHNTEFVWLLSGDDNRAQDGLDLRLEYTRQSQILYESDLGCSILEMLIALSKRAAWNTSINYIDWFWIFIENLGLSKFNDAYSPSHLEIEEILYRFIWRTYDYYGRGGLFPLVNPKHDQRKVEIWYQFAEYLIEQERL